MATYKYCAFTYTTPNDEHEGQYGVDIVAQEIQYGEHGVMSNIGPAIHNSCLVRTNARFRFFMEPQECSNYPPT